MPPALVNLLPSSDGAVVSVVWLGYSTIIILSASHSRTHRAALPSKKSTEQAIFALFQQNRFLPFKVNRTSVKLFTLSTSGGVLGSWGLLAKRINAMNEMTIEQNNEEPLIQEISDAMLEITAGTDDVRLSNLTQWICTAVYFCPGP
jgi:hypothetical protein